MWYWAFIKNRAVVLLGSRGELKTELGRSKMFSLLKGEGYRLFPKAIKHRDNVTRELLVAAFCQPKHAV